jgi:hypothetical protein
MRCSFGIVVFATLFFAGNLCAQQPVLQRRARVDTSSLSIYSFEFQGLYYGREGPNYSEISGEPSKRAQQYAIARLSGQDSIASAKFEAVDARGAVMRLLYLFKANASLDDDEYWGWADIPDQPFRVMVSGQDINGTPYKRTFDRLFRPKDEPAAPPRLPPGIPADAAAQLTKTMLDKEKKLKAEFGTKRGANPDGVNVLPRIQVANVTHEPYKSANGSTLGIRLSYDIQFSQSALYTLTPSMTLSFDSADFRAVHIEMQLADETISPKPEFLQERFPFGFHRFFLPAQYKNGVVYHFVADMVPGYVIQNVAKTKYCIYNREFQRSPQASGIWEAIKTKDIPVRYQVSIMDANFHGEIQGLYPQKMFYEGFLRERAQDCGDNQNVNF